MLNQYSTADVAAQKGGAALGANNSSPGTANEDGAAILDAMVEEMHKHVILGPYCAEAIALWVMHAHSIDAHQFSPRLHVCSPLHECGKTTLLTCVGELCGTRGQLVSNLTIAAFFRYVDMTTKTTGLPPVMLLDEVDTFLSDDRKDAIGIMNSGHARAAAWIIRCGNAESDFKVMKYGTWAPLPFGSIGKLPAPSLESRTIVIKLMRKRKDERVEKFRDAARVRCAALAERAQHWCAQNDAALRQAEPEIPECLYNRLRDSWEPLLAVADAAGGRWPEIARAAAIALSGEAEDPSEGAMLLSDIRKVWLPGVDQMASSTLLERLRKLGDRPWGEEAANPGAPPPFQSRHLAKTLKPFGIEPRLLRFPGNDVSRGYRRAWFEDAWGRYLPEEEGAALAVTVS